MARILFIHGNRGGKFQQILEYGSHEIVCVDFSGLRSRLKKFVALWHEAHRFPSFDVVIADDHGYFAFSAYLISVILRCPYFIRLRGDNWDEAKHEWYTQTGLARWRRRISRSAYIWAGDFALRRASRIIPVSGFLRERAAEHLAVPHCRFAVIPVPCSVPPITRSSGSASTHIRDGLRSETVLLMVTNFNFVRKVEAIEHFHAQIEKVLTEFSNVNLLVVGDGMYLGKIRNSFYSWVASGRVKLLGYRNDVASLFNSADVFIHLSFQDAFPNVVIEAQAYGIPTVVNDFGGMVEQVVHDETGVIVSSAFPESLYVALKRLLTDTEYVRHLRSAAPKFVRNRFSLSSVAGKFDQILDELNECRTPN